MQINDASCAYSKWNDKEILINVFIVGSYVPSDFSLQGALNLSVASYCSILEFDRYSMIAVAVETLVCVHVFLTCVLSIRGGNVCPSNPVP